MLKLTFKTILIGLKFGKERESWDKAYMDFALWLRKLNDENQVSRIYLFGVCVCVYFVFFFYVVFFFPTSACGCLQF